MNLITAIRSQGPIPATAPATPEPMARMPVVEAARPVAGTQRKDAVIQARGTGTPPNARLAERDESDHPATEARAAAEAARRAYIEASRAIGISPLPLPGV
jgi:hypothetical protein